MVENADSDLTGRDFNRHLLLFLVSAILFRPRSNDLLRHVISTIIYVGITTYQNGNFVLERIFVVEK